MHLIGQAMDQVAITAASGLRARMQELDMLANNLANSGTGGFKLDREFYSLFPAGEGGAIEGESDTTLPVIQKQWTDFSQGTLQLTGNPLDMAISGKGFFAVNGPSGTLYTRNGSFKVSADGTLTTQEGYAVSGSNGPIQVPEKSPITVGSDGTLSQGGTSLGTLELVNFADPSSLGKMGNSYFTAGAQKPTPTTDVEITQGAVEGSNVTPAESAVRLVGVMRQFEMLSKAIALTSDMDKKSIDEVARITAGL
jgi:flagellar basal-body rod protein FlgF